MTFYYSPLFELSLRTHTGHVLMHAHFLLVGYLFANVLIGIDPGPARPPYPMRLLLLFATMAFHAFFGVALVQGNQLLAPEVLAPIGRTWGRSPAGRPAVRWRDRLGRRRAAGAAARHGHRDRLGPLGRPRGPAPRPAGRPGRRRRARASTTPGWPGWPAQDDDEEVRR